MNMKETISILLITSALFGCGNHEEERDISSLIDSQSVQAVSTAKEAGGEVMMAMDPSGLTPFLEQLGMREIHTSMIEVTLRQLFEADPGLLKSEDAIRDFFNTYLSYDVVVAFYEKTYQENFTKEELEEIIAFYSSPLGKKVMSKMPTMMQAGMEFGQQVMITHSDELIAAIESGQD